MADGTKVKASPERIRQVSQELGGLADDFSSLKSLLGQAADITGVWGGDGSAEFVQKVQECLLELGKMDDALHDTCALLNKQAANYETAQQNAKAGAQKLMG